jgi:hypothetical protein
MIGKIDCLRLFVLWIFKNKEKELCSNIVLFNGCKFSFLLLLVGWEIAARKTFLEKIVA